MCVDTYMHTNFPEKPFGGKIWVWDCTSRGEDPGNLDNVESKEFDWRKGGSLDLIARVQQFTLGV